MAVSAGARIGPYEIVAPLGAGGMGEVYRARDTKLNRDVAIKILPDLFSADPERLARFKREAQVLASLKKPNIAHVYGFEEPAAAGGPGSELRGRHVRCELRPSRCKPGLGAAGPGLETIQFLVMELVEGETLDARVASGPIPIDEPLPIARQICQALEAAHEKGIIHRDLEPENVFVTRDGRITILESGLAKLTDSSMTLNGVTSRASRHCGIAAALR